MVRIIGVCLCNGMHVHVLLQATIKMMLTLIVLVCCLIGSALPQPGISIYCIYLLSIRLEKTVLDRGSTAFGLPLALDCGHAYTANHRAPRFPGYAQAAVARPSVNNHSTPQSHWYENMTSSMKPEVHNISQRRQRRTEPRPRVTCINNGEIRSCCASAVYAVVMCLCVSCHTPLL